MKNKKLFAILTLVCFMFTLMPVAAFAAPADTDVVKVQDGTNWVESVYVMPSTTTPVAVGTTCVEANTTGAAFYVEDANGNALQIAYADQTTESQFYFTVPGTYTVYAVIDNGADADNSSTPDLEELVAAANSLIDDQTVANAVAKIKASLKNQIVKTPATVVVEAPEATYQVLVNTTTGTSVRIKADNGFTTSGSALVTVNLKNNNQAVVGKVPTIVAPEYVNVVPAAANKTVTDVAGNINYVVSANRAGNFNVVFGYEDATEVVLAVNAYDNAIANVEVVKESASKINKTPVSGEVETGAFVKFTDVNGTVISTTGSAVGTTVAGFLNGGDEVKVTVVSQPTTSRLTAANIKLATDPAVPNASELVITGLTNDLKVGSYKVKFALENGKSVTVGFEAAKIGNIVGIRFVQPATTIALGEAAPVFTVEAYDANGVTAAASHSLSYNGKAWDGANSRVFADEKYIGSTITVLAKSTDNRFVATTTLEVVDNGMEVVYAKNTAEVGVTTQLTANVVDVKGNKVVATTPSTVNIVVLEKPENAYVYANAAALSVGDRNINVTFLGSVAGEYKIQTIVVNGDNVFVTGIETITVGANEASFKDVIVMSIGANKLVKNDAVVEMPAAPEIVDSRTMVPARAGLEAFGATVVWDEATQTVTAELGGVKVVMTIGEKAYTVNGKAVVGDAAPYISTASTMVPVSFFTNAFGITATPIYDEVGVCDVLFTK